jgi:hypothetical protein
MSRGNRRISNKELRMSKSAISSPVLSFVILRFGVLRFCCSPERRPGRRSCSHRLKKSHFKPALTRAGVPGRRRGMCPSSRIPRPHYAVRLHHPLRAKSAVCSLAPPFTVAATSRDAGSASAPSQPALLALRPNTQWNAVGAHALAGPFLHDSRGSLARRVHVGSGGGGAGGCGPRDRSRGHAVLRNL